VILRTQVHRNRGGSTVSAQKCTVVVAVVLHQTSGVETAVAVTVFVGSTGDAPVGATVVGVPKGEARAVVVEFVLEVEAVAVVIDEACVLVVIEIVVIVESCVAVVFVVVVEKWLCVVKTTQ
jgi:hypothetical protein